MAEDEGEGRMLRAIVDGETVLRPGTIDGVRATLTDDEREAFERAVGQAPAYRLPFVVKDWAFRDTRLAEETNEAAAEAVAQARADEVRLINGEITIEELHAEHAATSRARRDKSAAEERPG
ncbi:hypothetical protein [Embleya sp. AB8]|uniref:hypothetical protein n=1 Tax=Embleya sp. AB8 TaxID=3156304 RepID=UPI003C716461